MIKMQHNESAFLRELESRKSSLFAYRCLNYQQGLLEKLISRSFCWGLAVRHGYGETASDAMRSLVSGSRFRRRLFFSVSRFLLGDFTTKMIMSFLYWSHQYDPMSPHNLTTNFPSALGIGLQSEDSQQ